MAAVKFALALFGLSARHYPEVAKVAEEHGFESVWIPEHLVLPADMPPTYPYSESGYPPIAPDTPMFDPWVVLGTVASATTKIRLATNVYVLPLRHPMVTARAVLTLDRVSGGRVTLGIGVGWLEEEFEIAGQSFHDRGRRTDEIMGLLRQLWTEDTIDHQGEFYQFPPLKFAPKTLQKPNIPIEVGGATRPALRRAGQLGDGWIEAGARDFETLKASIDTVLSFRRDAGREHLPFEITTGFGRDLDTIHRCEEIGVTRVTAGFSSSASVWAVDSPSGERAKGQKQDFLDHVKRYADSVIAQYQA
jgi:probable F420-dependent oxidoreductase